MPKTVLQLLPDLNVGGVERGTVEIARALTSAGYRALVCSNHGPLVSELTDCGAEHIAYPIGKKSLTTLGYVSRLRRLIRENNVDVLHARSRLPAWIGWFANRGLPPAHRAHWVTTVHGPYSVNRYSQIMVSGERVIAISNFIYDYVMENYPQVDRSKIHVIHRGTDEKLYNRHFRPAEKWLTAWRGSEYFIADKRLLIFAGRLTRWKGQLGFIELVDQLRHRYPNFYCLFVGNQSDPKSNFEAELRAEVSRRGLQSYIKFLGQRNDLKELFAISDLSFSLPEIPEAFGRTTLEALSLGTPVVGYDRGGTGEILREIFPAGLVEEGNLENAVDKTEAFLRQPPTVGENQKMTVSNMQSSTIALYESLLIGDPQASQSS